MGSRIQRDQIPTSENFASINSTLIWNAVNLHQIWKQTFERNLVYILENYFRKIASGQLTSLWCFSCYIWNQFTPVPSVSVAYFEHIFVSWVRCEQRYIIATCCFTEKKLHPKCFLGFSIEPIRTRVNDLYV